MEEIRLADAAVYAGRRLHDDVVSLDDETSEKRSFNVASEKWGIFGKVDAARRRDGAWVVYEHKRGRSGGGRNKNVLAWPSDRVQAIAYAVLLEEALDEPVFQARVRYHRDNVTAFVEIDDLARKELAQAIERARSLRRTTQRPPITDNENLCRSCSLAPVCLPEEERLVDNRDQEPQTGDQRKTPTLFPSDRQRQTLHVVAHHARIGRRRETLTVTNDKGQQKLPINDIDAVVVHGFGQVSTQAIQLCARHGVSVQWFTAGGKFMAGLAASPGRVQQRIRQYQALTDADFCLRLSRQLMHAKVETQLRFLLRATRSRAEIRSACSLHLERIREVLKKIPCAKSLPSLLGFEGIAAKAYFASLPYLLAPQVAVEMQPQGRSKHPPRDRFNCALSFGYALIHGLVHRSILAVGLEPAFGFYHQPRTAAPPLVLDVMELFRTPLWEMPLLGSINRGQWNIDEDFELRPGHVWLSDLGRRKALALFEKRLVESYKHPHTGQSLAYTRIVELEVRLLEKEWSGCPGLFAQLRMR